MFQVLLLSPSRCGEALPARIRSRVSTKGLSLAPVQQPFIGWRGNFHSIHVCDLKVACRTSANPGSSMRCWVSMAIVFEERKEPRVHVMSFPSPTRPPIQTCHRAGPTTRANS